MVEGQLEPGLLLSACPLTQEGIDLLQQTQGVVSAVTRSATREQARPLSNSTRTARGTRRGAAENTSSPVNSPGSEGKYEIASNSRATEMCDENDEGLDSAAAIAFGNLLCEKKPIDWCEAQSRDTTARLVIKLLRAKAKREDIPADELKNREIDPDEVERLLGDEPVRVYVPLMLRPWVMDRTHKEAVHLGEKVTLAMLERYYYWVGMASRVQWWIRRCYACQTRKKARDTVQRPLVSLPLPSGQARWSHSICWDPSQELIKGMSTPCWSSTCPADTLKDTLYRLTRRRDKVAQPSWYTTTSRDGVSPTLSFATEVQSSCPRSAEKSPACLGP